MLAQTQQPTASRRHTKGHRAGRGERSGAKLLLAPFLAMPIALLVLAAPASASGAVTDVLSTVATVATPAVSEAASASTVAPSPAAAPPAGEVPVPAPVERAVEHTTGSPTTGSVGTVGSELPTAISGHDQATPAGPLPRQPESTPSPREGPRVAGPTPPRAIGSGDSGGSGGSAGAGASSPSSQRPSGPVAGVVQGVVLTARQVTSGWSHSTYLLLAGRDERRALPWRLADAATAGPPARAVRQLVLETGVLGASRPLGDVGATVTQLVETTPGTIAPLLAPMVRTLSPSSLLEPALLPELPSLGRLPVSLALPLLLAPPVSSAQSPGPAFTPALAPAQSAPPPPTAASVAAGAARIGADTSSTAAPEGTWQASMAAQAYAATAHGLLGVTGTPDRRGPSSSAVDGQPSPAPSPGGASPASGAVAGTSIPMIFLTLAGLLLLAAPRVRRVLGLLGESWRLSPLALIPERPG
jgi:hypothetical protein